MTLKRPPKCSEIFRPRSERKQTIASSIMCCDRHGLKLLSHKQFAIFLTLPVHSLFSNRSGWLAGDGHVGISHCGAYCDVPSQRFTTMPGNKGAAVRALPIFLNQASWFFPHWHAWCTEGTADTLVSGVVSHNSAWSLLADQATDTSGTSRLRFRFFGLD